jgi:hypothetical protein
MNSLDLITLAYPQYGDKCTRDRLCCGRCGEAERMTMQLDSVATLPDSVHVNILCRCGTTNRLHIIQDGPLVYLAVEPVKKRTDGAIFGP